MRKLTLILIFVFGFSLPSTLQVDIYPSLIQAVGLTSVISSAYSAASTNQHEKENDTPVLSFKESVETDNYIQSIELPTGNVEIGFDGVSGRSFSEGAFYTNKLSTADTPVVSDEECGIARIDTETQEYILSAVKPDLHSPPANAKQFISAVKAHLLSSHLNSAHKVEEPKVKDAMPNFQEMPLNPYNNEGEEIIVVGVDTVMDFMLRVFQEYSKVTGTLIDEITERHPGSKIVQVARKHLKSYKDKIDRVIQDDQAPSYVKDGLNEIHLALAIYAGDEGLYSDFNAETRKLMLEHLSNVEYFFPYTILMVRLWEATRFVYGTPKICPKILYRGVTGNTENFRVGQEFSFPQFISTSYDRETAEEFCRKDGTGTLFKFLKEEGTQDIRSFGNELHSPYGESEVLLPPTIIFKVTKIYYAKGRKIIECVMRNGEY